MKVLFVTKSPFGAKSATGQMLNNLFEGLPEVQVLQYCLLPTEASYIQLIDNVHEMQNVKYSVFCRLETWCNKKLKASGKVNGAWRIIKRICDLMDGLVPPLLYNSEITIIKSFKPDVIYSLAADIKVLRICNRISTQLDIPIVLHNMDDFYNMKYGTSSIIRKIANYYLRKAYKEAYNHSRKSLAIGPKMRDEYSATFEIPFDWVMNCVPNGFSLPNYQPKESIELIIFSGGLHGGRAYILSLIAQYLESMNGIKMEVYTGKQDLITHKALFSKYQNSNVLEYVERDKMFDNLSRADILLHVESFDSKNIQYFRLSMSTKIPEYMAVGRPILCVGSDKLATVDFLKTNRLGHVINNVSELGDALMHMTDKSYRKLLVNNARESVKSSFEKKIMQRKLKNVFEFNVEEIKKNNY